MRDLQYFKKTKGFSKQLVFVKIKVLKVLNCEDKLISISDQAARQIQHLQEKEKPSFLRIAIKEGGCSGFSYKLDFDTHKGEKDRLLESKGVKILVDSKSLLYLMGMVLDFDGGLNGKGFTFSNPNAKKSCGCGFSFGV